MTYHTVEQALNRWFNKRLSKLPQEARTIANAYIPRWDELSADGRLARARIADQQRATKSRIKFDRTLRAQEQAKKDPKQIADWIIGWYDYTLNAAQWFFMDDISPKEAAMLLCQLNPHNDNDDPLASSNGQTTPHEYKLLLRAFEGVASTVPKHRTLKEWLAIAQKRGLRYHDWIAEYMRAVGVQAEPKIIDSDISDQAAGTALEKDGKTGITKGAVINSFEGIYFDRDKWCKYLGDPPNWLKECRVAKGNKKTSSTWNPALIAAALFDKKINIGKLDAVFVNLGKWNEEWREISASFRE